MGIHMSTCMSQGSGVYRGGGIKVISLLTFKKCHACIHMKLALWSMDFLGHSLVLETMAYLQGEGSPTVRPFLGKRRPPSEMKVGPLQQG